MPICLPAPGAVAKLLLPEYYLKLCVALFGAIRPNHATNAPNVWISNNAAGELVMAPQGTGNDAGTNGKTTAWLVAMLNLVGNPGYLSFEQLNKALTTMENDLRVPPFSGSDQGKDNVGMADKFVLVCSTEAFNQFTFDPWQFGEPYQKKTDIWGDFNKPKLSITTKPKDLIKFIA